MASMSPLVDLRQPFDFVDHGVKLNEADVLVSNFVVLFVKKLCNPLSK
jgi:hypothetical protein